MGWANGFVFRTFRLCDDLGLLFVAYGFVGVGWVFEFTFLNLGV